MISVKVVLSHLLVRFSFRFGHHIPISDHEFLNHFLITLRIILFVLILFTVAEEMVSAWNFLWDFLVSKTQSHFILVLTSLLFGHFFILFTFSLWQFFPLNSCLFKIFSKNLLSVSRFKIEFVLFGKILGEKRIGITWSFWHFIFWFEWPWSSLRNHLSICYFLLLYRIGKSRLGVINREESNILRFDAILSLGWKHLTYGSLISLQLIFTFWLDVL